MLQGNTSIILQWGGSDGVFTNMRKLDLDIGKSVNSGDSIATQMNGQTAAKISLEITSAQKMASIPDAMFKIPGK